MKHCIRSVFSHFLHLVIYDKAFEAKLGFSRGEDLETPSDEQIKIPKSKIKNQ